MTTTLTTPAGVRSSNRLSRFAPMLDRVADPLGYEAGDANLRRYVGNSPTNAIDPSGLEEADPFPPPATHTGFTAISGQKAIIDYLSVTIEYKKGKDSSANCPKNSISIGADQSKAKQLGHIYHELMSILSNRFLGYAEGSLLQSSGPFRPAVFPNGKPVPLSVTGIHNLGIVVELAALAEHAPGELTPDYVDERFGTVVCRDPKDKDKSLIYYEKTAKEMVAWIKEAFEGKHDGEIYKHELKPAWTRGSFDKEILSVKIYLKADKSRIVEGKVHIVMED
jgi:hypothetical protein